MRFFLLILPAACLLGCAGCEHRHETYTEPVAHLSSFDDVEKPDAGTVGVLNPKQKKEDAIQPMLQPTTQ